MHELFGLATIIVGSIGILFGIVKGWRDLRTGGIIFTEVRMVLGGALCAFSTMIASATTPWLLSQEYMSNVVAAMPAQVPAHTAFWWVIAIMAVFAAFVITPTPRQMMAEYAIERAGLVGMMTERMGRR